MEKKHITIGGQQVPVVFNVSTLLAYEEISGKSFFGEHFERTRERLALICAAAYAADNDTTLTIEQLMQADSWQEVSQAFTDVMDAAGTFFNLPKVVEESERQEAETTGDDGEKN